MSRFGVSLLEESNRMKRMLLRAVPSISKPVEIGDVILDETEFRVVSKETIIVAIRAVAGAKPVDPEPIRDIVKVFEQGTNQSVVGIYLENGYDLEVYEVDTHPDIYDALTKDT